MLANKEMHLKRHGSIILLQTYYNKPTPICIPISQTSSLEDLYQKVESILYPTHYTSFENKSPNTNSMQLFYDSFKKDDSFIYRIFVYDVKNNKYMTIPKSTRQSFVSFMDKNEDYFTDHSRLPQLHNLYRIFVMDRDDYNKFNKEYEEENSIKSTLLRNVQKLTKCFPN